MISFFVFLLISRFHGSITASIASTASDDRIGPVIGTRIAKERGRDNRPHGRQPPDFISSCCVAAGEARPIALKRAFRSSVNKLEKSASGGFTLLTASARASSRPVKDFARQKRNAWLQGTQAMRQRQQRVFTESDNVGFFLRQNRRARAPRPHRSIVGKAALLPLGDSFRVDPCCSASAFRLF